MITTQQCAVELVWQRSLEPLLVFEMNSILENLWRTFIGFFHDADWSTSHSMAPRIRREDQHRRKIE
jgi:hypothetical protein